MNLGSATVARKASETAKVMRTVATSSVLRRRPSGTHSGQSMSMSSSPSSLPPSPSPLLPPPSAGSAGGSLDAARARTARARHAGGEGNHLGRPSASEGRGARDARGVARAAPSRARPWKDGATAEREMRGDASAAMVASADEECRGSALSKLNR